MEKLSNYTILITTIFILIVIIIVASIIKINNNYDEKLLYAMKTKVEYYAERCYLEKNCSGEITLSTLYDRDYLEEIVNPVTKEIIDYNTVINYNNGVIIINW